MNFVMLVCENTVTIRRRKGTNISSVFFGFYGAICEEDIRKTKVVDIMLFKWGAKKVNNRVLNY